MITAQLELLPRENVATKHAPINRGSGNPPLESHRRGDSNEDEDHVPENDAPWRFLVDDRAGCRARLLAEWKRAMSKAEVNELIAKGSTPEYPRKRD